MSGSDRVRTVDVPGGRQRQPQASQYQDPEVLWEGIAGRVSDAGMRARAIVNRYGDDPRLAAEMRALIHELDAAFSATMRAGHATRRERGDETGRRALVVAIRRRQRRGWRGYERST